MSDKKKHPKTYFEFSGMTICMEDLVDTVNKYDKDFGIKLKHPDIWCCPEQYRQIIEARAELLIAAYICAVNGISVEDYFETDDSAMNYGTICRPVGVENLEFTDESYLRWIDTRTYNTDSLIFRCRFVTLVLSEFLGRMDKITEQEVKQKKRSFMRHSSDEQRIMLTKRIVEDCDLFVHLMLDAEESYKNIILVMQEHLSYTKRKVEHQKLRTLVNGHVIQLRRGMVKEPFTGRFFSDDVAIFSILKITYMMSTNKTNVNTLPKFKYIESATVKHNLIKLIEELGSQIIKSTNGKNYAPMFKAFIDSSPSIWTEFYKEAYDNLSVKIGICAIEYTKFILNDKTIDKFIDEMKKKGI